MTVWETAKVYEVVAKVRTEAIIAIKFYAEMWTNSISGADVLGPTRAVGARGGDEAARAGDICTGVGASADCTGL